MPAPRRLVVLTTGRQDYGILRSTLRLLRQDPRFEVRVWAGGMAAHARYGREVDRIRADGMDVSRELAFCVDPPDPMAETARALALVGYALAEDPPDALLLLGDRPETLAAGMAATLARVPIVHLHGGEESLGAIDNACRHALTKLSHLHLVSHPAHARRVLQLGEDAENVVVVGAPGTDNLCREDLPSRAELEQELGLPLRDPVLLVTLHPTTLGGDPAAEVRALAGALARIEATCIVTQPNADAGADIIRRHWREWAAGRQRLALVDALGERRYWAALRIAAAVVGNSSSGIIEAPAAGVPVVNIGDRQAGRLRVGRVQDVPAEADAIEAALRAILVGDLPVETARDEGYPSGPVAPRIVEALARWQVPVPPRKQFVDQAWTAPV